LSGEVTPVEDLCPRGVHPSPPMGSKSLVQTASLNGRRSEFMEIGEEEVLRAELGVIFINMNLIYIFL
jgi:hypothetical protein